MPERTRKRPTPKQRLEVMKRDGYKCVVCGDNPITSPGVNLEVDHYVPFSKGGADDETNFQTLCRPCNRGKGNDETLNKAIHSDLFNVLDRINPAIRLELSRSGEAMVIANTEDFAVVAQKTRLVDGYRLQVQPDTIIGYGARAGSGIYTLQDNGGGKTRFRITSVL